MTSAGSSSLDGKQSLTLLIDTSQKRGCLLLVKKDFSVLHFSSWQPPKRHTEELVSELSKIKKNLKNQNLKRVVFISGPGSFTGLRVGASVVKSLGLIFPNCTLYCLTSFKLTALAALKKLNGNKEFSIYISSIGNMAFRAKYQVKNGLFYSESIDESGAKKIQPQSHLTFSPNSELCAHFPDVQHIVFEQTDYISALEHLDQYIESFKVHSHLDLYPLYLRKSEAEEKYSYDKVKL